MGGSIAMIRWAHDFAERRPRATWVIRRGLFVLVLLGWAVLLRVAAPLFGLG